MSNQHTGIAVLEGKWWGNWNCSVKPTFDMISEMTRSRVHGYHYEMVNSGAAIEEAVPRISSYKGLKYLYVAMHGAAEGLLLFNKEVFSATRLGTLMHDARHRTEIVGLYLASCAIGNSIVASQLHSSDSGLIWIAGYQSEVDWLQSSALDILFFQSLLTCDTDNGSEAISHVAGRLGSLVSGLVRDLDFHIYIKDDDGVKDILSACHA